MLDIVWHLWYEPIMVVGANSLYSTKIKSRKGHICFLESTLPHSVQCLKITIFTQKCLRIIATNLEMEQTKITSLANERFSTKISYTAFNRENKFPYFTTVKDSLLHNPIRDWLDGLRRFSLCLPWAPPHPMESAKKKARLSSLDPSLVLLSSVKP